MDGLLLEANPLIIGLSEALQNGRTEWPTDWIVCCCFLLTELDSFEAAKGAFQRTAVCSVFETEVGRI